MGHHPNVQVIGHPMVQQKLTSARDVRSSPDLFRRLLREIAMFMAFEITREYQTDPVEVETPLAMANGAVLRNHLTLVPILRAGLGMADGILQLIPQARVGLIGIYRDETSLEPQVYYNKLPQDIADSDVIVIDPMLATGGSCIAAIDRLKQVGATSLKLLCLVAAPEGIAKLTSAHPEVLIYTAAIDRRLDERGYIIPGLGDAGDRIFGTI